MIGLPTIVISRISSTSTSACDASPRDEARDRLADGAGHRLGAALVEHRVRDAAHQVLAEPDLRVHHAVRGEDLAVGEIREVPGDRRRADVQRDAERPIVQPGPDAGDDARRRGRRR